MIMLTVLSLGLGAVLGLRFRLFILVPIILFSAVVGTIAGFAQGADFWPTILKIIVASAALQIGYLVGAAAVFFIALRRAADKPRSSRGTAPGARPHVATSVSESVL
jgi:hypothetical protein